MTGTTRSNNPWIKEQAEFFESVTTKELNVLNELGNEHLKWFSECTTIRYDLNSLQKIWLITNVPIAKY